MFVSAANSLEKMSVASELNIIIICFLTSLYVYTLSPSRYKIEAQSVFI